MLFAPCFSSTIRRNINSILAAAALAAIAGCASNHSANGTAPGNTNSSAVNAPGASQLPQDNSQSTASRYYPTGDQASSVLMVQAAGPHTVRLQRNASYQFNVTNLVDMPIKDVVISSTNPDGFQTTGVTGSTTQPADGGHLEYTIGDLGPKQTKSVMMTGFATKVGSVDTCYAVRYTLPTPPTVCTNLQVTNPTLALTVQAPPDTDICKSVTYQYTVTNTGTGTVHNVVLQENLPEGLTTTDGKQAVIAFLGDIPQGDNRSATALLKASKTGSFSGQATAKSDDEAALPAATVTAVHAPMLTVAVTGGANDYVGKQVPYQIVVTNKGDAPANNAKVQIGHPADGIGSVTTANVDRAGMVALGDLAPNASKTITAMATSEKGGTVMVMANATADCASAVSANAQTIFATVPALLLETVDEVDPVKVGDNVVYDVKVTNQGSGPDTNINVKAMIPDGEEYVSTDGPTQPSVSGMNLSFPAIPTLNAKESVTWKVTVKATKAQDVQFKTSATSDGVKAGAEKTEPTKLY